MQKDEENLSGIDAALKSKRIDMDTAEYLRLLYANGEQWLREVFYMLGLTLGAPKTAVFSYDYKTGKSGAHAERIVDINPWQSYIVHHRLDTDPMRNQFFESDGGYNVQLLISSIVSVIVGAQKSLSRALDKITGKYYEDYTAEVLSVVDRILSVRANKVSANAIVEKIRARFADKFITTASEVVLEIIGKGHERIAVELIRELDKIRRPHHRLQDVYRIKMLFDMVPQARIFMQRLRDAMQEKVMEVRDRFFDVNNPRNYRDAKIILNIGDGAVPAPMEIICQVRKFFDFELQSHTAYEAVRKSKNPKAAVGTDFHNAGINQYNQMICSRLDDLFERVGWNILYSRDKNCDNTLFEGFPQSAQLVQFYPPVLVDRINKKIEDNVQNEVFKLKNTPRKIEPAEEIEIFKYMARFVMVSAIPVKDGNWKATGMSAMFFNFVMAEVSRWLKK